jgi:hypothetical protein
MTKTDLIPFDLGRWQKADFKRVITREGEVVNNLTQFNVDKAQPLYGQVGQDVISWNLSGRWMIHKLEDHQYDLMLEVEQKPLEGWVRVYKGRLGNSVYKSYEAARDTIDPTFVTIIKIEYPNDTN